MHPPRPVTAETLSGRFQQTMTVGPHRFVSDELVEDGGEDAGPSPFEWLAAGLAACTSMTVKAYADVKQWPLVAVHAKVTPVREAERLLFVREVRFEGALDDTQRARLVEISKRCPVHKALSGTIAIETQLVD